MAEYEWTMYQNYSRLIMLSCTEISFVKKIFSILRNLESNPGFLLRNQIELLTKNLEKK